MLVSKMLKEHFLDYESHTVTQPPLQQKLEILDRHLTKSKISKKIAQSKPARPSSSSNAINAVNVSTSATLDRRTQRPGSAVKPASSSSNNPPANSKPPTNSKKQAESNNYISQTSRGVSK